MAMCDETGKNGTYHTHLYIYFTNAIMFSTIKMLFPTAHIDAVKGSSYENRCYLLKSAPEHNKNPDGSYQYKDCSGKLHSGINHSDTFEESGECPDEHQGKRNDLEKIYEYVKDGYTNSEIIEMCGEPAILHVGKLDRLRHSYLIDEYKGQRRLNLVVHYITGQTGTGKSRNILDEFGDENCYRVTDYDHPFDSYQCEPVLIFEEFRSQIRLSDMLNYLDIYPVILPARYSPKVGCYSTVFVVSNWTFEQQYSELQKDEEQESSYQAWIRRFNGTVKEYYDVGKFTLYPTIHDYLNRKSHFIPVTQPTPFDNDKPKPESMPFD
jgi:hypothetical protein